MAKPSSAGFHTPRPTSLRSSIPAARSSSSSSSSSAPKPPVRDIPSKVVAKCLDYYDDDNFTLPAAALTHSVHDEEDDLAPLLDLPDPEVSATASTVTVAASDDNSSSSATEGLVTAPAHSTTTTTDPDAPLPEQMNLVLSELHGATGLSPRSKRVLAALAEAATAELTPTPSARRAAFWGKLRVAVLAATLATVAAVDVALAAYLYARHGKDRYHVMPPT